MALDNAQPGQEVCVFQTSALRIGKIEARFETHTEKGCNVDFSVKPSYTIKFDWVANDGGSRKPPLLTNIEGKDLFEFDPDLNQAFELIAKFIDKHKHGG